MIEFVDPEEAPKGPRLIVRVDISKTRVGIDVGDLVTGSSQTIAHVDSGGALVLYEMDAETAEGMGLRLDGDGYIVVGRMGADPA